MSQFVLKPSSTMATSESGVSLLGVQRTHDPWCWWANVTFVNPRQGSPFLSLFLFFMGHLSQRRSSYTRDSGRQEIGRLVVNPCCAKHEII